MKPTMYTLNSRRLAHQAISMILLITIAVSYDIETLSAQILEHGNYSASPSFTSSSSPQFQSSQNMAILKCIPTDTWCNGFDYFTEDGFHYIVMPADGGYRFHDVTDPSRPLVLGQIELPDGFFPRDAEIAYYGDTTRLFLVGIYRETNSLDPHRPAVILDVVLTDNVSSVLLTPNGTIANTEYISYGVDVITPESGSNGSMIYNIEMLHRHDRMLFVASNTNALQYYSIAHHQLRDSLRIIVDPDSTGTLHKEVKIHEVKASTYQEGSRVVGLGTVRSGIRILDFTSEWENPIITAQIYDFDRTIFPDTIINPYKYRWDTLSYSIDDPRCNKWDHRVTHSVLPYDSDSARYLITVDEFTNSVAGQHANGEWNPLLWEGIDFYEPNRIRSSTMVLRYYNSAPIDSVYENVPDESSILRLNYNHRNHHSYPNIDPLRLQGAFLRIWDRSLLGINDTSVNRYQLVLNAYDVQESSVKPEGYLGLNNIPKIADVPTGLHEPILHGNLLYLAGYNSGARILQIAGRELSVRGYTRTEPYLSNDPSSSNYYNRPDLIMYAKGIYRLVPDTLRPGLVYGSDLYQGIWVFRYIDSTITDTLTHIPFQPSIRIGTMDPTHPERKSICAGGAVIADSAIVEFVDNTTFSWETEDSLVVLGVLRLGAIHLDSTQYPAPRNRIFVADGGVVYIGGMEKTITGRLNLHVGPGGRAVILAGTTLQLADTSLFLVEGDLTLESCVLSDGCHFIARDEGVITIDSAADVSGLLDCTIADNRSMLRLRDASIVRMQRGGAINVYGRIETPAASGDQGAWCRIQSMHAHQNYKCQPGDEWNGILLYGNWHGDVFENAFVHQGYPGLWVYSGNPTIQDCEFSNNFVGCRVTEGQARLTDNRFEKNEYIGLDMQLHDSPGIAGNRINRNVNYGLYLYGCADSWFDNRIDSNSTGAYVSDYSDIYLNEWGSWSPSMTCDSTRGNSIRHNRSGIRVAGYSSAEFHCDNSVYRNYSANPQDAQDIVVYAWSRAVGWGNYPDTTAVSPHAIRFVKEPNAIAQWDDPSDSLLSPANDPVLHKAVTQSPFASALARGRASARQGNYPSAQSDFSLALDLAVSRDDFLSALYAWRRMVASADRDSLSGHPGYRGTYWTAFTSALGGKAAYADSTWMRNIATEVLLVERIRRRDTSNTASTLQSLASGNPDAMVARRTHLRQVFFNECIRGDHVAALGLNQMLQTSIPRSQEALYAKILLRLHLDSLDREALAKQSAEERAKAPRERPIATGLVIEGPWPVPQRTDAFLRIWSEEAAVVDRVVYDLRGAVMRREPGIPLRSGWNDMTLRLDGFAPGTYMLVIENHGTRHAVRLTIVGER